MLETLAQKIDTHIDNGNHDELHKMILECNQQINLLPCDSVEIPSILYFISNIYSALRYIYEKNNPPSAWSWQDKMRNQEILNLRKCITHSHFQDMNLFRRCQALTNLANIFNNTGRIFLAIDLWDKAIGLDPYFSMAIFNKAEGLLTLAPMLYDEGHRVLIYEEAYYLFTKVYDDKYTLKIELHALEGIYQKATQFIGWWESIVSENQLNHTRVNDLDYKLDSNLEVKQYHQWCLNNRLFINPLNDISCHPVVNHDIFTLPSITTKISEGPYLYAMMEHMKQEYVSARYMLFNGISNIENKHFSDETLRHVDTMDHPINGLWVEHIKNSFKTNYSILDKISTFLNEYYKLNIDDRNLSFRSLWYKPKRRNNPRKLKDLFNGHNNLALRGLYWISKDLMNSPKSQDNPEEYLETEAERILTLRNRLEHGYVRVVEDITTDVFWEGDFATKISYKELINNTFLTMRLAREALLNLGCAITIEEQLKPTDSTSNLSGPIPYMP